MKISHNHVVQLHYSLSDEAGLIESSAGKDPILYLHGHQNMLPAIEKALEGKAVGETCTLELSPAEGYGEYRADAIQAVQVKYLQGAKKWKAGMHAMLQTEQGLQPVKIVKVGMFKADVDTNHPLAGKQLKFNFEILAIRAATDEEIAHGHAHGVGGHHHH